MSLTPYVSLTVGRASTPGLTVSRGPAVTFTTYGHPGSTVDHVLTTEAGAALELESGEFLLTA